MRIDGRIHEMDALPQLDGKRKHTIEAVVDRMRVRADAGQRLAESFETALRLSGGLARLAFLDEPQREELVFSSRHACPVCGYSVPPLEPKLFSFNNPSGACPSCDGLGVQEFFDPQRVVLHPHLSLAGGAVRGWDRRNDHYFQLIQSLARHYGFDIETPWTELPEHVRHVLLYGSAEEAIEFSYRAEAGRRGAPPSPLRRHPAEPDAPLPRDRVADGARGARALPGRAAVPGVSGHTAEPRRAFRIRRRAQPPGGGASHGRPRAGVLLAARPAGLAR